MSQSLRVLVLEDSVIDADLVIREPRRAGYEPQWTRVETEADFLAALATEPELILADYSMPHFDGLRAVQQLRATGSDIPFILVSGMQGEDAAVEAMKQGATDYLLKDRITRLGSAVERAMEEKRLREERRRMDTKLHESEERLRLALHAAHLGTFDWDVPHNRITWSRWHEELWGFQLGEFAGTYEAFAGRLHPDDLPGINAEVARCIAAREPFLREFRVVWPDGSVHWIAGRGEFTFDEGGQPVRMRGVVGEITARRQAEAAQRISDLALKSVSQGVVITGPDQLITSVNAAFVAITGYPATEILGRDCRFLQGPATDPATVAAIRAALGGPGGFAGEILNYRRDGTPFWNDLTISPVLDGSGRPTHFIGITRDITDRKRAETERDRLFDLSLDLLCVASFDGRLEQVNPAWTECLGWTAEELLARPMSELIHPDDHEETARIRGRVQQGEQIRGFENRYRAKDGSYRWFSWSVHPLVESRRVFAVARDVTARKRTEEALRASEARLRLVTDNARVGLMMIDRERRYTFANATYAEMFGLAAENIVGRRVAEVLPQLYEMQIRERLDRAFAGERRAYEVAWPTVGEHRHYLARYEPTKVDGAITLVVVVITDITERQHAEEALRASGETQRQLAEQLERERARLIVAQEVASVGSWETDLATLAVVWSAETFRIFEKNPKNFQPTHPLFLQTVHPEDRVAVDLAFTRSLRRTGPFMVEHRLAFPDGRIKFVEERWVVVAGGQSGPARAIGTCQDITTRRQAEDVIRTAAGQMRGLAGRLQVVREEERTALAREIHDVLAQELTRLKIDLVWLAKRLGRPADESSHAAITSRIADAVAQTDTAITTVQRIATELRPVILDSLGLPAAVEWQAEDFARRTGIACQARVQRGETVLGRDRATAIFRILQESLTNVARHAEASKVEVEFVELVGVATLIVRDNGVGISRTQMENPHSIGLLGMKERTLAFGGTVEISGSPGAGTTVVVRLPIPTPARPAASP